MYLDHVITAHNLLQAIARVNRVSEPAKEKGFIVDYVGVGHHLKRAIDDYDEREQKEILDCIGTDEDELNDLLGAHRAVIDLLKQHHLTDFTDYDAFFDTFYDEEIRFQYITAFKALTRSLNLVYPRKEALDYFHDYQSLAEINALASQHLNDPRLSMKGIPAKLRTITDAHLTSKGIDQRIAPISILDADFESHISKRKRTKTKAAEVEHAIRHHIDIHIDTDPELYASFAEAIEKILQDFKDNWGRIYEELEKLRQKIRAVPPPPGGLDRKQQMPFFRILCKELYGKAHGDDPLTSDEEDPLIALTRELFDTIKLEIQLTGFWQSIPAHNRLKAELQKVLLSDQFRHLPNIVANRKPIITRLMELARANTDIILYAE